MTRLAEFIIDGWPAEGAAENAFEKRGIKTPDKRTCKSTQATISPSVPIAMRVIGMIISLRTIWV